MIYYLMGKSASGKDTVYKKLRLMRPQWREVVLYTTRPIRDGERDGVEYHFVTGAVLEKLAEQGRIIESRTYHTVYGPWTYATVDDGQFLGLDSTGYLMIGTLESYRKIRDYFGEKNLMPLYIEVPNEIRMTRALAREQAQKIPKLAEMHRRFEADELDFSEEKLQEAGIVKRYRNLEIESCVNEIIKDTGQSNI